MAELIITGVNIFVLSFCLGYFLSPMIEKMLSKRKEGIAAALSLSRQSREDARQEVALYERRLEHFEDERQELLLKAGEKAGVLEAQILAAADEESQRILARARREADLLRAKLEDEMRREMVTCGSQAAARLIAEHMDEAACGRLIDETLKEMGEETWRS